VKLTGLSRTLLGYPSYRNVVAAAQLPATERSAQTLIGAVPGLHAPLIADIAAAIRNSTRREGAGKEPLTLVITPTERQAEDTAHALGAYLPDNDIALLPAWRRELDRLAPAFEAVPTHRLIHGDVVATNVILGPDGVPRFIDFEWSGPGDTAKDLALIGGRVIGGATWPPCVGTAR